LAGKSQSYKHTTFGHVNRLIINLNPEGHLDGQCGIVDLIHKNYDQILGRPNLMHHYKQFASTLLSVQVAIDYSAWRRALLTCYILQHLTQSIVEGLK